MHWSAHTGRFPLKPRTRHTGVETAARCRPTPPCRSSACVSASRWSPRCGAGDPDAPRCGSVGAGVRIARPRLDVGASLLASVSAAACFLRWRLEGIASTFWAGLLILVLGLSGFLSSDITRAYAAAGIACSVVSVGLAVVWLRGYEVDATLSVRKVLSAAFVALVVAFAVALVLVAHGVAGVALSVGIGGALVGVALAGHVMWSRDRWMIVVLAAYGASHVVFAPLSVTDPLRAAAASSLHLVAMGVAAFGSTLLLHEAAARQREAAFRSRRRAR